MLLLTGLIAIFCLLYALIENEGLLGRQLASFLKDPVKRNALTNVTLSVMIVVHAETLTH